MNHLLKGMLFLLLLTLSACANYDKKELIGNWEGPHWKFNFQEDGLLDLSKDGNQLPGLVKYRTFGNALEITKDGTVFLSNLTIKSIKQDTLQLEFRMVTGQSTGDNIETLIRK